MTEAVKESKAQRVERLKRELNPWEAYTDIQRFAREGWDSVPPEWFGAYFRWWGVYTQGDGVGAIGGKGGEGKAVRHLMVRIRMPNGVLDSRQLRTIADLAERHGRGIADITVRQNFQLHWVTLESLPEVFEALWLSDVTTMGACGDVTRNITGCPVAGFDADELIDASPLVQEATELVNGNADFYNLPRKFKVSISGCRAWCAYPEVNDIGLTAVRHPASGEVGFAVRVGGARLARVFGSAGGPTAQEAVAHGGRLGEPQLEFAHVVAAHRLRKARDGGDAHARALRQLADASARGAGKIVENERGHVALGRTQFGHALRNTRDDVEAGRIGGGVHCRESVNK